MTERVLVITGTNDVPVQELSKTWDPKTAVLELRFKEANLDIF